MIRKGTYSDIPKIIEMATKFWADTIYDEECEPESVDHLSRVCIDQGLMVVLDLDGVCGFACGIKSPLMASSKAFMGVEVAWWVEPEHRAGRNGLRLLKSLEASAHDAGIKYWNMLFMESSMPDTVEKIYQKMGYNRNETTYIKRLR
jgi:N-acetylglutamate synthase-like GNAT family acetyltransferase